MDRFKNKLQKWFVVLSLKMYYRFRNYCLALVNFCLNPKLSLEYGAQTFFLKYIKKGDTILDIGCSRGDLTRLLSFQASHIDAFDISAEAIAYAQANNNLPGIFYAVKEADLVVESSVKHYNVTVLGAVLSFLNDKEKFLQKLKPLTDIVLIRETKFDNDILALVADSLGIQKSAYKEFRKSELITLLKTCGYKIIEDFDTYDIFIAATALK